MREQRGEEEERVEKQQRTHVGYIKGFALTGAGQSVPTRERYLGHGTALLSTRYVARKGYNSN